MCENIEITLNNVNGCKYLYNSKEGLLCTLYDYDVFYDMRCADNPDCYYKQLQRITTQYNKAVEQNRSLQKELQRKNQEIENLKEKNKCIHAAAKIANVAAAKIANDSLNFVTAKRANFQRKIKC